MKPFATSSTWSCAMAFVAWYMADSMINLPSFWMGNKPLVVILGLVHEVWFTALKPKHGHIMYIYISYIYFINPTLHFLS